MTDTTPAYGWKIAVGLLSVLSALLMADREFNRASDAKVRDDISAIQGDIREIKAVLPIAAADRYTRTDHNAYAAEVDRRLVRVERKLGLE